MENRKSRTVADEEVIQHLTEGGRYDMSIHVRTKLPCSGQSSRMQIIDGVLYSEINEDNDLERAILAYLERVDAPFSTLEELFSKHSNSV